MGENKIVKADSKAYGYNYASLADIIKQGFTIPKMRVKPCSNGQEYMEYLGEDGEWHTGARIVVPEMKGMNITQAYGSALTYARRYTAQMALALACDDDQKLEKKAPTGQPQWKSYGGGNNRASDKQIGYLRSILEKLNFPADQMTQILEKAKQQDSKTVSAGIKKYQDLLKAATDDVLPTEEEVDELEG